MRPFDVPPTPPQADPTPATLTTPLGTLGFRIAVADEPLRPAARFGEGLPGLWRFGDGGTRADLLLFALEPALPEGMVVHGCVAAVWRVEATVGLPAVELRAAWEPGVRTEDGGVESGECLMALTWDAPGVRLSLGTTDEERLAATAQQSGFLPPRLAGAFGVESIAADEREGLAVGLPPLRAGEAAQIHFVVAWRTGAFDPCDVSAWYAVDVLPERIADLADAALADLR